MIISCLDKFSETNHPGGFSKTVLFVKMDTDLIGYFRIRSHFPASFTFSPCCSFGQQVTGKSVTAEWRSDVYSF